MRIGFWPVAAAVVLLLVGGAILLSKVIGLSNDNRRSIAENKATAAKLKSLACRTGAFLVDAPIVKVPGVSERDFERQVERAAEFLRALRVQDCSGLGHVTTAKINRQIHKLRQVAPAAVRDAGLGPAQPGPTVPGTASPSGSTTTTPGPEPPAAGLPGPRGPPGPPAPPPPTTTPQPPPRPPLLRPVCRRVPALCKLGLFGG